MSAFLIAVCVSMWECGVLLNEDYMVIVGMVILSSDECFSAEGKCSG